MGVTRAVRNGREPMTDNRRRVDRYRNPYPVDPLGFFPSESEERPRLSLFTSTPRPRSPIAHLFAESQLFKASRRVIRPTTAADASLFAGWKWLLAALVFLPPAAVALVLSGTAVPLGLSTNRGSVQEAAGIGAAEPIRQPQDLELAPDSALASPPGEPEGGSESPKETTPVAIEKVSSVPPRPLRARTRPDVTRGNENTKPVAPLTASDASPDRFDFVGSISLESQPAGAQVFIDGQPLGVTPLVDWKLPAGSHVVRVELDGYNRWSAAVRVITAKTLSLVAALQPAHQD